MQNITYIYRNLINREQLLPWAAANSFELLWGLHITIAYSRTPIDLTHEELCPNSLEIIGGSREIIPLGDINKVAALKIQNRYLQQSFNKYKCLGASWDYPEYIPHISVATEYKDIEPFLGSLVFGPEQMKKFEV